MAEVDVLIIGGGPAGLTAAIYLSRFHLKTLVVDSGVSRAALIPLSRNHAGFPDGVSGTDLLDLMRMQALKYGVIIQKDFIRHLEKSDDLFTAAGAYHYQAKAVLLATGVTNNRPPSMSDELHDAALARGLLRYCPICDAYEVTDKRVGVIGTSERGTKEAMFLRSYTSDLTLIAPAGTHELTAEDRHSLKEARVKLVDTSSLAFNLTETAIEVETGQERLSFDSIYPALGSVIHSDLAKQVGAKTEEVGCAIVDTHQRTNVAGLYAAGDVVYGLDQISHAMGEGGVAATTIRNDLAERQPLHR